MADPLYAEHIMGLIKSKKPVISNATLVNGLQTLMQFLCNEVENKQNVCFAGDYLDSVKKANENFREVVDSDRVFRKSRIGLVL